MEKRYLNFILRNIPKVLSQIDRDEDSPSFGCCDRNHWHYKIRDFSSAILQQSGFSLAILYNLEFEGNPYFKKETIKRVALGTLDYWTRIQLKDGSFNEYYPHEHGFPPTAFSFFTACEIYKELNIQDEKYFPYFRKTARYLINHIEKKASNQEMGSITALYSYYTICEEPWVLEGLENKLHRILKTQSPEGWFPEYGGADFGYQSVCFDMLAEYYFQSRDERVVEPLNRIVSFIKYFVHPDGTIGGEYGSRNTLYFLPFGLELLIHLGNQDALEIRRKIFENIDQVDYFQNSIDDRYFSHYVLHSYLRSLKHFSGEEHKNEYFYNLPCEKPGEKYFEEAGLLSKNTGFYFAVCSLRKGGVIKIFADGREIFNDFGYRIPFGTKGTAATNWVDPSYDINYKDNNVFINGRFNLIKSQLPTPIKHMGLRTLSLFLGNKLIGFLKKQLIFINNHLDVNFNRQIIFKGEEIQILDIIKSAEKIHLKNANSLSLRHVASGKFFKISELVDRPELDLQGVKNVRVLKTINFKDPVLIEVDSD